MNETFFLERAWSFYARLYDVVQPSLISTIGAFGDLSYEEFEKKFVELAGLKSSDRVLDVACGTGATHAALHDILGPKGKIVGVDISGEMLRRAEQRAGHLKMRNIRFQRLNAEELSVHLEKESFDAVVSCNGLPNFLRPRRAIIEMAHVLRPGGTLAVSTINRDRCEKSPLWRLGMKYPRGRLPYKEEYRKMLKSLGFVRISLYEQGLMLIITARKRMSRRIKKKISPPRSSRRSSSSSKTD